MTGLSYQLITFDWDGTLMNSQGFIIECLHKAAYIVGLPRPEESMARRVIGLSMENAAQTLFPNLPHSQVKQLIEAYRHAYFAHDRRPIVLFEGVRETLARLVDKGYWLAIATGKSRRGLEHDLEETGIRSFFSTTRTADDTASKPDPQMLKEIINELGVVEASTLMIGDTEYDIQMANNAGVDALAVSYGAGRKQELLELSCIDCIDSVSELIDWLEKR